MLALPYGFQLVIAQSQVNTKLKPLVTFQLTQLFQCWVRGQRIYIIIQCLGGGFYVLFRTHLAKIKCFNLRAEGGLEVNVVLEAQPSALRNREAIRVHQH